jgi:FkbM family methyltransferase
LFYNLGLTGVNVEANPHLIDNFHWDRSRDKNVCIGVGVKEGFQDFYQYDDYSGRNTFSLDEALSVFVKHGMKFTEKRSLPVKTLNQIVDEYCGGQFPEFLNCDLEGLDYDVLRTADFENSRPIVICVESRVDCIDSMTTMMYRQGYEPYARLGENVIFVLQSYHTSLLTYLGLSKPC